MLFIFSTFPHSVVVRKFLEFDSFGFCVKFDVDPLPVDVFLEPKSTAEGELRRSNLIGAQAPGYPSAYQSAVLTSGYLPAERISVFRYSDGVFSDQMDHTVTIAGAT